MDSRSSSEKMIHRFTPPTDPYEVLYSNLHYAIKGRRNYSPEDFEFWCKGWATDDGVLLDPEHAAAATELWMREATFSGKVPIPGEIRSHARRKQAAAREERHLKNRDVTGISARSKKREVDEDRIQRFSALCESLTRELRMSHPNPPKTRNTRRETPALSESEVNDRKNEQLAALAQRMTE